MDTTKTQYGKSLVKCRRITFRFRSRGLKLCNRLITVRVRLGLTGMRVSGDSLKSFREFAPVFVVLASQFLATTSSERPCKTKNRPAIRRTVLTVEKRPRFLTPRPLFFSFRAQRERAPARIRFEEEYEFTITASH